LTDRLGISDLNEDLLMQSLTHSSWVNDHPHAQDNERLEFLGDAVLSLCCSRLLFERYPTFREGQLSRLRASLVCEETLATIAGEIDLGRCLRLGKSAAGSGGYGRPSIMAGAVEALLGATYEGLGFKRAENLFTRLYSNVLQQADEEWANPDAKSALQELAPDSVEYRMVEQSGPDHDRWFRVEVLVNGRLTGQGAGRSKKRAEQEAARSALKALKAE
jgi:ribonuclease-3